MSSSLMLMSYLMLFLLSLSSSFSFWAVFKLSASARLSTAIAKKTFRRMSVDRVTETTKRKRIPKTIPKTLAISSSKLYYFPSNISCTQLNPLQQTKQTNKPTKLILSKFQSHKIQVCELGVTKAFYWRTKAQIPQVQGPELLTGLWKKTHYVNPWTCPQWGRVICLVFLPSESMTIYNLSFSEIHLDSLQARLGS